MLAEQPVAVLREGGGEVDRGLVEAVAAVAVEADPDGLEGAAAVHHGLVSATILDTLSILNTGGQVFIMSKVQCVLCFGNCITEGRGGEKGGSANVKIKHTDSLAKIPGPLYTFIVRKT